MDILASVGKRLNNNSGMTASNGESAVEDRHLSEVNDAVNLAFAVISFSPDGDIIDANENFLTAMGYRMDEIRGKHHRIFVDPKEAQSNSYDRFWRDLRNGIFQQREFRRIRKNGEEIWIRASYMPIRDGSGQVFQVVKYANDITQETTQRLEQEAKLTAIGRSQAVIEFTTDGEILDANDNFLNAMGYRLDELKGQHHRTFVTADYANSPEYEQFWRDLRRGEYKAGEYHRVSKSGDDIWIQASYNPVFDSQGKCVRVVKFATDITESVKLRNRSNTVGDQVASSVEQMGETIRNISENLSRTTSQAGNTKSLSERTTLSVKSLDESGKVIESVVDTINGLAEQTKLLALNATIEAARAGESGRGFAVVAEEVKDLARQTAEATSGIATSIHQIQESVGEVVSSTGDINQSVSEVEENMINISAAVEEQSATMGELSRTAAELRSSTA